MQRSQRALDVGCTRLVDLSLSVETGDLATLRRLIRSNPGLKTLAWNGPNGSELLEVTDLARLPHLEHLTLSRWDVSRGRFPKALLPVSGSLKTLRIGWVLGLHEGGFFGQVPSEYGDESEDEEEEEEEEEEEADLLGEGAAAGGDAKDDGNDISTTFMLPLLESYTTARGPPYAPDPAEFVKYCPNLTRLDLTLLKDEETVDIKRISDSLRNHCPKLRAFAERGSIPQDDKETLIRSCAAGLSELTAMMSCVRESTIDAIAVHASTLETLGIFNPNKDDANLEHISQLPARCPQLKWLSVSVWNSPVSHRAILDALKTSSWKSHSLERLDLDIQTPHEEHSDDSPDMIPVTEIFKGGQPVMGWYYHPDDPSLSDGSDFCLVQPSVQHYV
ncbi:hypothetical protein BGX29_008008 [Mortierella sp. GBA35]|nr:hypothetical protein BGX29_008008 [Mortierella sp. GBA35]